MTDFEAGRKLDKYDKAVRQRNLEMKTRRRKKQTYTRYTNFCR